MISSQQKVRCVLQWHLFKQLGVLVHSLGLHTRGLLQGRPQGYAEVGRAEVFDALLVFQASLRRRVEQILGEYAAQCPAPHPPQAAHHRALQENYDYYENCMEKSRNNIELEKEVLT